MAVVEVDVDVHCSECGNRLTARASGFILEVEPCDSCLNEACNGHTARTQKGEPNRGTEAIREVSPQVAD